MKHLLWCITLLLVAILAFGPLWIEEYELNAMRHSVDASSLLEEPPSHYGYARPSSLLPDGDWM